jgi:hypothetical protein
MYIDRSLIAYCFLITYYKYVYSLCNNCLEKKSVYWRRIFHIKREYNKTKRCFVQQGNYFFNPGRIDRINEIIVEN